MRRAALAGVLIALPLVTLATPADAAGREIFRQKECFTAQEPQFCVDNHVSYRDEVMPNGRFVLQFNQNILFTFTFADGRVVAERGNYQYKLTFRDGAVEESYNFNTRTKTADCTETVHVKQVKNRVVIDKIDVRC
jgi:hypothetical protein